MTDLASRLSTAMNRAFAIRPKVGGFPVLAEVLRQAGVTMNRWTLPACQSVYLFKEGSIVQQGEPLLKGQEIIPKFDQTALIKALRTDQAGNSNFPEFLRAAWSAGVVGYDVDFTARKVVYYGVNGESYIEDYPAVEV
ncbi:DUF1398 domain-containing protein [Bdellovibrio sp. HCB288]|uniref:DUF1398 domain-containing protein n=1 Tax=Bdellovibrio sp. HCB288 TaxID=3394355 RepID=UPI0039B62F6C